MDSYCTNICYCRLREFGFHAGLFLDQGGRKGGICGVRSDDLIGYSYDIKPLNTYKLML